MINFKNISRICIIILIAFKVHEPPQKTVEFNALDSIRLKIDGATSNSVNGNSF